MRILIYGSKEFAQTVAELVRHCGHELSGMVDDYNAGAHILGGLDEVSHAYPPSVYAVALGIGYADLQARWRAWQRIQSLGYRAPPLVHPRAYVADSVRVGEGVMVMAGAIVDVRVTLGDLVVVWPGACVNHDSFIDENTFISPNVTVCGSVKIGRDSFIGAASVIADHLELPASMRLKMQSRYTGKPS